VVPPLIATRSLLEVVTKVRVFTLEQLLSFLHLLHEKGDRLFDFVC
jgi:hypothetical protein